METVYRVIDLCCPPFIIALSTLAAVASIEMRLRQKDKEGE